MIKCYLNATVEEKMYRCSDVLKRYVCQLCPYSSHLLVSFIDHRKVCHVQKRKCDKVLPESDNRLQSGDIAMPTCSQETYAKGESLTILCSSEYEEYIEIDDVIMSKEEWEKSQSGQFVCNYCNKVMASRIGLVRHIKYSFHAVSDSSFWYKCDQCEFKSKRKRGLRLHQIHKHLSDDQVKWFECDQCPKKCKTAANLSSHRSYCHVGDLKWFQCDRCSYKSKNNSNLKFHKRCHHEKLRPFQCENCRYMTVTKSRLAKHQLAKHLSDDQIAWFKCDQCEYKSKYSTDLGRHKQRKHEIKLLKCENCYYMGMKLSLDSHIKRVHQS